MLSETNLELDVGGPECQRCERHHHERHSLGRDRPRARRDRYKLVVLKHRHRKVKIYRDVTPERDPASLGLADRALLDREYFWDNSLARDWVAVQRDQQISVIFKVHTNTVVVVPPFRRLEFDL